jgi:hypothetical protein
LVRRLTNGKLARDKDLVVLSTTPTNIFTEENFRWQLTQ